VGQIPDGDGDNNGREPSSDRDVISVQSTCLDETARALINKHFKTLKYYAIGFAKDYDDSEELFGITMLQISRKIHTFDPTRHASFTTWAYSVMKNEWLRMLQKGRCRKQQPIQLSTMGIKQIDKVVGHAEVDLDRLNDERFSHVLDVLSDTEREVMIALHVDGKSTTAVVEEFHLTRLDISIIQRSAKAKLMRALLGLDKI
jgi:RNA polymerase sigma factor (sigma-70 family)